ncbi:MAG: hypothetical protein HQM09_12855 [Candidatus Riflebacteria bacterium]|nr:hypothetical protein [Candidatus Riflebacteria bacterium]
MRYFSWYRGLLVMLMLILWCQTGCQYSSSQNPVAANGGPAAGTGFSPESATSVSFQIVLPSQTKAGAMISAKSNQGLHPGQLENILADTGSGTPLVTFKLILVNVGVATNPTTTMVKTVLADASGTAAATFSAIPARTCVGDIHIAGGNISSFSDFHGAADLISNATNTIFVGPTGKQGREDVLATVIIRLVASSTLFARATDGLAAKIGTALLGLDTLASGAYDTVLANWQGRMNASAPVNVKCLAGNGKNTLTWDVATGAMSYNIYWSTQSGVTRSSGAPLIGVSSPFDHTGRTNGIPYYYVVTSVGSLGESVESMQVVSVPATGTGATISFGTTVTNCSQNLQVIFRNVPQYFTTTTNLVDAFTGASFPLVLSPAQSYPNVRKVTLAAADTTIRGVAAFSSLTFSTAPPAGACIDLWDPDSQSVLASATVPGGTGSAMALGTTLTGLNQNVQIRLTNVSSSFSTTAVFTDKRTREEVTLAKSATLSFPSFQRLVLTTGDMTLRSFDDLATITFSTALPLGAQLEVFDADRQLSLLTVTVPSMRMVVSVGATIIGANQNVQIIITNVASDFVTSTILTDDRTGEGVLMSRSAALSFPNFQQLLLGVSDLSLRTIRAFNSLAFTTALPSGATVTVYDPEFQKTLAAMTVP